MVFDIETTGLNFVEDEILQFSAIDGDGNILLNTYLKPYLKKEWTGATRIHGITNDIVEKAPYPHEVIPIVRGIFDSANKLITYGGDFDMTFLKAWGLNLCEKEHYDVMLEFAPIYGEWDEYHGDYVWQKLTKCAAYYGYKYKAHDSLEDVKATLYCYQQMTKSYM